MHKTIKPNFTAETLLSAIPSEVIEKYRLKVVGSYLYIGYFTLHLNDRVTDEGDSKIKLKSIHSVTVTDVSVWINLHDFGFESVTLYITIDKICFNL